MNTSSRPGAINTRKKYTTVTMASKNQVRSRPGVQERLCGDMIPPPYESVCGAGRNGEKNRAEKSFFGKAGFPACRGKKAVIKLAFRGICL